MIVDQGFFLGSAWDFSFPSSRGDTLEHPPLRLCKGPWNEATSKAHPMGCALEWSFRLFEILQISTVPFEEFRLRRIRWGEKVIR